jgi:hypothetical protein
VAVRGENSTLSVDVSPLGRAGYGHATRERDIALVPEQALRGDVDRAQRRGARRLHRHRRAAQPQLVGHPGGEEILVSPDHQGQRIQLRVWWGDCVVTSGVASDPTGKAVRIKAGVIDGGRGVLEEYPLLRIDRCGLGPGVAEEGPVEGERILNCPFGSDEI